MVRQHALGSLCRAYGVDILYSFGSRGQEVAGFVLGELPAIGSSPSDCDIGAKLLPGTASTVAVKVGLAQAIEDFLGVSAVHLVVLSEADPFLACEVIRGERLFAADAHRADEFELYLLRRAGDLAPLERERERQELLMGSP